MSDVPAHDQRETIHLLWSYPEHEPRAHDPHYAAFRAAEARMKAAGLWKCVVCGSTENVQGHHSYVEFSLQNGIDVAAFDALYGLHLTDAEFAAWVSSEGNCEPLCRTHHTGPEGVHMLPEPAWKVLRCWRNGLKPPAEAVRGDAQPSAAPCSDELHAGE